MSTCDGSVDPVVQAEDAAFVREALSLLTPLHRDALVKRDISKYVEKEKEIGPAIYNQAIADAQAYFTGRVADLEGVCHEPEFGFWPKS